MKISVIAVVVILLIFANKPRCVESKLWKLSEIGRLKFHEIAAKYGYQAEEKYVYTEDGYILTMYHILGNSSRPVLLVHGNTCTADCWISRGDSSLALTLARRGHDVWAVNLRGTRYSRRHRTLDPDTNPRQFFNYSFHEQGVYDLPAAVDLVLQETGQEQLIAVGHSLGTTAFYVMGSELPAYNDKIKLSVSLAPICFQEHIRGFATLTILIWPLVVKILDVLNIHELFAYNDYSGLMHAVCLGPLGYTLCVKWFIFSLFGRDEKGFEPEFAKTFFGHFPGGTSLKMTTHTTQVALKNKFTKFDYGAKRNLALYGAVGAPEYALRRARMPAALLVGAEDYLATERDARRLRAALPNVVHYQVLPYRRFNHANFIWGRRAKVTLYPYLIPLIEKYS